VKPSVVNDPSPIVIPRDQHPISRKNISENALKVLYRLLNAGHQAFLVGGSVRDLLLGLLPKDFDVATSAHPDEVRRLFRNSRLIGRRFRLAHVRFGREIIEVSTFRSRLTTDKQGESEGRDGEQHAVVSDRGVILRDNVYGTVEQDAQRRDFTINALYYTPADFSVYDYTGGMDDLEQRQIRLIGDPEVRYREDPVRMLRGARFAAKLDFHVAEGTLRPIDDLAFLLEEVAPARLFDELTKLLLTGYSVQSWNELRRTTLLEHLLPLTWDALDDTMEDLILDALHNTDKRIAEGLPVTPGFLVAVLLWPALVEARARLLADGRPPADALHSAALEVIAKQQSRIAMPRRFSTFAKEMWELQPRLERRQTSRVERLLQHPRFRAAYDFLVLRAKSEDEFTDLAQWWERYQALDSTERSRMRAELRPTGTHKRRRSSRSRSNNGANRR
jgi:poly(A) polymerase